LTYTYVTTCLKFILDPVDYKIPENKPAWMPEKISKPFVKKEKIETIE